METRKPIRAVFVDLAGLPVTSRQLDDWMFEWTPFVIHDAKLYAVTNIYCDCDVMLYEFREVPTVNLVPLEYSDETGVSRWQNSRKAGNLVPLRKTARAGDVQCLYCIWTIKPAEFVLPGSAETPRSTEVL